MVDQHRAQPVPPKFHLLNASACALADDPCAVCGLRGTRAHAHSPSPTRVLRVPHARSARHAGNVHDAGHDGEPGDLIQSVSRALRIMEEVSRSDRPLPVKVIARRCRLHVSTAYHLVRTLCYEGYLVRLPSGDYVAGSGLAERFHELMNSLRRPPQARAVLRQLAETTGHSAYLACISGQRLVVVDLEEGERSPWLEDLQPGLETAAHATAVGKALLATLPRRDRRELLAEHGMRPFTSNTVTEPAADRDRTGRTGTRHTGRGVRPVPRQRVLCQHRGPRRRTRHLVGAGHHRTRPGHARRAARRTAVRGQRPHLRPESPALMPPMNAAH